MFAHKLVPHPSSQCALARMAKTLSFYSVSIQEALLRQKDFSLHT